MGSALRDHWPCVSDLGRSLSIEGPVIGELLVWACPNRVLRSSQNRRQHGRLSLRRAALLASGSAGGPRGPGSLRPQSEAQAGADLRPGGRRDLR